MLVFETLTFLRPMTVLGVLDDTLGSRALLNHTGTVVVLSGQPGALFEDNAFGVTTCVLSLTTNFVVTILIAYKLFVILVESIAPSG